MRVYFDVCCLGRPTDDQSQARIRAEAEAVEGILFHVRLGEVELMSSEALQDEVRRNPSPERRLEAEYLLSLASVTVEVDAAVRQRSRELAALGYGKFDAVHLAAAESGGADVLLTTDDGFIRRAARGVGKPLVPVRNPLSWFEEREQWQPWIN